MKKVQTRDGEITVYEDHQSGDTFDEFEENQNREEYYETVLDYFRSPEYRKVEDNPDKPELVEKIEQAWNQSSLENWRDRPENREEREQKLELFWTIGKILAEFYEKVGHKRRQCPQCGYYSLETVEKCGGNASNYKGCGYEFDYVRDRGYSEEESLEKGLGAINPDADSTSEELVEEWGEQPLIEGMHSWMFITKFKKFYWMFPDQGYSTELSYFHQYVFASYYNARVIVLPVYWDLVEKAEQGDTMPAKEVRQVLSDAVEKYQEQPRRNFLMKEKYRQYKDN